MLQFNCTKAQHTMIGLSKGNSHNSYTDITTVLAASCPRCGSDS